MSQIIQIITMLLVLTGFAGLSINSGIKTYQWTRLISSNISPITFGLIYAFIILLILAVIILSQGFNMKLHPLIIKIAYYALGLLVYMIIFINVISLILFFGRILNLLETPLPKTISLISGIISAVLIIGLFSYGVINANLLKEKSYEIQLTNDNNNKNSLKIALISDIHLGYIIGENHIKEIVDKLNKIKPDIVCITGDIFDNNFYAINNPNKLEVLLKSIKSKYGVYACLGNHDAGSTYENMLNFLSNSNINLLQDESITIDNKFTLIGRKDSSPIGNQGDSRNEMPSIENKDLPVILMDHQPGNIREYDNSVDLILSGHTHKGQFFPFNLITNAIFDVDYGYYRKDTNSPHVIVTSGAGTWGPPLRVGSNNEIVEITLKF